MPSERRPTIDDIAEACGVSRATVSLVLRGSPLVSESTRQRVQEALKLKGYVYHRGAANLRARASNAVALVIHDLSNPFFAEFAAGVDEELAEAGHVVLLGGTGESVERQQAVLASLLEHDPAGLILSPAEGTDPARLRTLLPPSLPVVVFNRELPEPRASAWDYLGLDNVAGARLATEHLLSRGHRRIAFFGGNGDSSSCHQRRQGYLAAMYDAGIEVPPHWLIETASTRLQAASRVDALWLRQPHPTAAVGYNDAVALGLIAGLSRLGIQAGIGFAVTGFDDVPEAAVSIPPLTTLATEPHARGRQAAQLVLARRAQPGAPRRRIIAPVTLRERASSDGRPVQ